MPYGLTSDTHKHGWSAFSKINADGVNSRLQIILDEMWRAAETVKAAGGDHLYHAGDFFHVRGEIAPNVLNPCRQLMKRIRDELGVKVVLLAGNHDLTGRHADSLGNAARALEDCGVIVVDELAKIVRTNHIVMFAWEPEPQKLLERMAKVADQLNGRKPNLVSEFDAIIHAPVNGVIKGLPDHGLEPAQLSALGFKRVFSGHYHNHVEFPGNVWSIGASTHQTWGDVGTKAGFMMVYDDRVEFHESTAPKFVHLSAEIFDQPEEIIQAAIKGNYVQCDLQMENESELNELREGLLAEGAAGVVIKPTRKPKDFVARGTVQSLATMEGSIAEYIKAKHSGSVELLELCLEILAEEVEL